MQAYEHSMNLRLQRKSKISFVQPEHGVGHSRYHRNACLDSFFPDVTPERDKER